MKKLILISLLIASVLFAFGATKTIPWQQADKHYGEFISVKGAVYATYSTPKVCFINFAKDWTSTFSVVIFRTSWHNFSVKPPCKLYEGHIIVVTGIIKQYRGRPEIIVKSPKYIEVLR